VLLQPVDVAPEYVFFHVAQKLHGLGLRAGLARVIDRIHHLDLDRHDVTFGVNPA
jgi:hypothetical protein